MIFFSLKFPTLTAETTGDTCTEQGKISLPTEWGWRDIANTEQGLAVYKNSFGRLGGKAEVLPLCASLSGEFSKGAHLFSSPNRSFLFSVNLSSEGEVNFVPRGELWLS